MGRESQGLRGVAGRRHQKRRFEDLYLESYDRVFSYACLRMPNDSNVEDVVSEAYLKAARAFDYYDPSRAQFSTWVITILNNVMVDYWRRTRTTVAIEDVAESAFAVPDTTEDIANRELVAQLVAMLEPDEADLVLMKYRDGKHNSEIAAELDMNVSTVSTKLSRAIQKMRRASERMTVA